MVCNVVLTGVAGEITSNNPSASETMWNPREAHKIAIFLTLIIWIILEAESFIVSFFEEPFWTCCLVKSDSNCKESSSFVISREYRDERRKKLNVHEE